MVSYCDRPLSVVRRRAACVNFFTQTSSPETAHWIFNKLTEMIPGWSPTKVVQIVPVGCISMSRGQKIGFQNAIFKNLLV